MIPVDPARISRFPKERKQVVITQIAIYCGHTGSNRSVALAEVALRAPDEIVRARLYNRRLIDPIDVAEARLLPARHGIEQSYTPATPASTRQLGCCVDGGFIRRIDERDIGAIDKSRGLAANSSRVKKGESVGGVLRPHVAEREDVRSFDEEWPALG